MTGDGGSHSGSSGSRLGSSPGSRSDSEPPHTPARGAQAGRRGGTRAARRVQWASDTTGGEMGPARLRRLDERGLDPDAFETLTEALERHQSVSKASRPSQPEYPIEQNASLDIRPLSPSSTSPSTRAASPVPDIPGEAFIDANEKAGLPVPEASGDDQERRSHAAASKLVRAHTRRTRFFARPVSGGKGNKRDAAPLAGEEAGHRNVSHDSDIERGRVPHNPRLGSGVLSALLTLYDGAGGSGTSTPGRARSSTSPRSRSRSRSPDDRDDRRGRRARRGMDSTSTGGAGPSPPSPSLRSMRTRARGVAERLGARVARTTRPPQARSAGGVLAPLIASTGNLSGLAAPVPSTVAPDPQRPGYHISRYSYDEGAPAPRMHGSAPGSRTQSVVHDIAPSTEEEESLAGGAGAPRRWADLVHPWVGGARSTATATDTGTVTPATLSDGEWTDEKQLLYGLGAAAEDARHGRRRKRRKAEIYITRHVAEVLQRQEFILKLARALMMFGAPSHRLPAQVHATARVLDVPLSCLLLPDVMLVAFEDAATSTSSVRLIRQASALNLGKLQDAHALYWDVIHDEISVSDASRSLDALMQQRPLYNGWQVVLMGGCCSAAICSVSFYGSFVDSLVSFPLGCLLVVVQILSVRNELYSNVFEITIATLLSFLSAALASTHVFCYSAVASASVVLILPGFIVLMGSLELASRNIVPGSVRLCFAVMYALFLGFGLAIGASVYEAIAHRDVIGPADYSCSMSHDPAGPWWQRTPSARWAFLTVPMYALFLTLRNQAPWRRKELPITVAVACVGWTCNHFGASKFPNQNDISSAIGAFAVGIVANVYARFFAGNAFVIMITGILFQVPSGLGNGGLLTFVSQQSAGSAAATSFLSGFQTALQLVSVSVGLTVGLGISLVVVHPIQSRKRAGGIFSL